MAPLAAVIPLSRPVFASLIHFVATLIGIKPVLKRSTSSCVGIVGAALQVAFYKNVEMTAAVAPVEHAQAMRAAKQAPALVDAHRAALEKNVEMTAAVAPVARALPQRYVMQENARPNV
jgi:hypothetical protein